jgi:ribosomal protein L29
MLRVQIDSLAKAERLRQLALRVVVASTAVEQRRHIRQLRAFLGSLPSFQTHTIPEAKKQLAKLQRGRAM